MSPDELATWEKRLQDPDRRGEAARVLAQELRPRGGGEKLAVALEVLAIVTRDPGEEAQVLAELGRLRLSMRDPEQAALALARAVYLAPGDASLLKGLRDSPDRALAADVLEDLRSDAPPAAVAAIEAELAALR
ncbi:MAG TPA: hypothetical protein VGK67_26125 [Myxococcales bacterium]|jgi:hypothetical protein